MIRFFRRSSYRVARWVRRQFGLPVFREGHWASYEEGPHTPFWQLVPGHDRLSHDRGRAALQCNCAPKLNLTDETKSDGTMVLIHRLFDKEGNNR